MRQELYRNSVCGLAGVCAVSLVLASGPARLFAADEVKPAQPETTEEPSSSGPAVPNFFKFGAFELRPYFLGSVLYDDNIRLTSSNELSDVEWTLTPGLLLGAGDYRGRSGTFLFFDYHPNIILYDRHHEFNSLDHWLELVGQKRWEKFQLSLGQSVETGDGGYTEGINHVQRSIYVTTLRSLYYYSEKTSFELNGFQNINDWQHVDTHPLINNREWQGQAWANYQATAKINVGLGFTFGYRDIEGGTNNQTYEQVLVRGVYALTEKTRFTASIGGEFDQYNTGGNADPLLVFSLGGSYEPRAGTTFTLEAYRNNQNSVLYGNQNYIATGVRASARQRVWDRVTLSLSGGYETADYRFIGNASTPNSLPTGRKDHYYNIEPAIDYHITERWYVGIFYQYRHNDSTALSYTENQAGLHTSFRF